MTKCTTPKRKVFLPVDCNAVSRNVEMPHLTGEQNSIHAERTPQVRSCPMQHQDSPNVCTPSLSSVFKLAVAEICHQDTRSDDYPVFCHFQLPSTLVPASMHVAGLDSCPASVGILAASGLWHGTRVQTCPAFVPLVKTMPLSWWWHPTVNF